MMHARVHCSYAFTFDGPSCACLSCVKCAFFMNMCFDQPTMKKDADMILELNNHTRVTSGGFDCRPVLTIWWCMSLHTEVPVCRCWKSMQQQW